MTVEPVLAESAALTRASEVVDLCARACEAYQRPDLATRLGAIRRGLADPAVHVVVAGEFKQGKSSLVNALLGASVCPVDDDVATAVPTYVRHGPQPRAQLLYEGDPLRRETIGIDDVRMHVVERDNPLARVGTGAAAPGTALVGVEIELPRKLLAGGLVMVDTPGVGGLGSAHAAASLAAISMADAVIFVSDASQELTRSELDFVHQAGQLCRTVVCVLTKTDFYPAWRTIRELNQGHLRAVTGVPLMAVSSTLRARAAQANDTALNTESGFPDLVRFVTERVSGGAADRIAKDAAAEVSAVCDQISAQFEAERTALSDPAAAQRVIDQLTIAKQRVDLLRSTAAKWNQTLSDGIADLNADIDHDLRARIRTVLQEADDSVENVDPADTWPQMESWLQSRISYELLANYTLLRSRADALSADVGDHFREASGQVLEHLAVYNPTSVVSGTAVEHKIELEKMKVGKQAMVALKSAYGGALMFTMLGAMTGIVLGPISVGIGLVMGHKGLREEKKRQLLQRRNQARNAIRRYCDEVSFVMGKDSRDTLRRIQRQLRDHYSALAEELNQSNSEALTAASEAVKRTQADRDQRLKALDAELGRLRALRQRAAAVTGDIMSLIERTRGALARAIDVYRGTGHDARLSTMRARLDEPLRVAIAGRVKSGKSTLLNALIGERLAPTDAGECTRIITWYVDGHTYQVVARPRQGEPRQLRFTRDDDAIEVDLGGLTPVDVDQMVVTWPSQALRTATLIDTPGIGSLSEQVSRRAWELLAADEEETPADAVVYLMRHLHAGDLEFLRAFHDTEVSRPNPVNAIGVLSRADEIGVGRIDSMASARRIAGRLSMDPNVRRVVQTVVPIAGLLAETAVTLTESEVAQLRRVAELEVKVADDLLLTADRFAERMPELGLTSLEREALLRRFGLYGVRLAATLLRRGLATTATDLARDLADRSGIGALQEVLRTLFFERRDVLKSRSALLAIDNVLRAHPRPGADAVAAEVEEIVASAHPFNELRVLSSVRAGWVTGKQEIIEDLEHVIGGSGAATYVRLRLDETAGVGELTAAAKDALARWQRRAENPMTAHELVVAARVAVRSCEGMLAELGRTELGRVG